MTEPDASRRATGGWRAPAGRWRAAGSRVRSAGAGIGAAADRTRRHPVVARVARGLGLLAVTLAGVALGVLLAGRVSQDVGPFHATFALHPSLSGGTEIAIPPLGSIHLADHAGPAHLTLRLERLEQQRTRAIITDPGGVTRVSEVAVGEVGTGVRRLVLHVAGVCVLAAMLLAALVYRTAARTAAAGGLALATVLATVGVAGATFRAEAIEEPRFEGLLTNAPAVIGDARRIAGDYEEYRAGLQRLLGNVGRIYGTISSLPVYQPDTDTIRVLHISDLHLNPTAWAVVRSVVEQHGIDVVVDTGDIHDWGSEQEAGYVASIAALKVPYVYVRGNHDSAATAAAVARQPNAIVLDNGVVTVAGLTFAGIGDPRFTPDKSTDPGANGASADAVRDRLERTGTRLAETVLRSSQPVDVAMVHDPVAAEPLAGACPVVLAGHRHKRDVRWVTPRLAGPKAEPTLLMVQGSTGGAGLRGLESDEPLPLEMTVLYYDRSRRLQAYDDYSVGGTGRAEVSLQRNVVRRPGEQRGAPSGSAAVPSPAR